MTNQSIDLESEAVIMKDKNFEIILKSPNGNCFNLKINNTGEVETFAVICPN